ncbi:MAG: ferric reductase-like transmembrane domain-containing protein [Caldilineaceae bacterium]|nr:ferric reductase-like transmembrane domain-containing protein [Caldilineaceae bacterium]
MRLNPSRVAVHVIGAGCLLWIVGWYLSGALMIPERYIILRSGTLGLLFLVASLACTPVRRVTGWMGVSQLRRPLGLYGFVFVLLHFGVYALFENGLDPYLIWRDLGERRAMPLGIAALLLLTPLAITSTRGWQRRLGRRWRMLHWLVYPAAILSVWHYLWLDRDFKTVPQFYAAVVGLLLLTRLPWLRRQLFRV